MVSHFYFKFGKRMYLLEPGLVSRVGEAKL